MTSLWPAALAHTPVQQTTQSHTLHPVVPQTRSIFWITSSDTPSTDHKSPGLQPSGSYTFLWSPALGATPALASATQPHDEPPQPRRRCPWSSCGPRRQHSTRQLLSLSSQTSSRHHRPLPASCRSLSASWRKYPTFHLAVTDSPSQICVVTVLGTGETDKNPYPLALADIRRDSNN